MKRYIIVREGTKPNIFQTDKITDDDLRMADIVVTVQGDDFQVIKNRRGALGTIPALPLGRP